MPLGTPASSSCGLYSAPAPAVMSEHYDQEERHRTDEQRARCALSLAGLFKCWGGVQVKVVQQYLEELLEQDVKFLVFCHHKVMNDGIAQVLNKCGPARILSAGTLVTPLIGTASFPKLPDNGSADSSRPLLRSQYNGRSRA